MNQLCRSSVIPFVLAVSFLFNPSSVAAQSTSSSAASSIAPWASVVVGVGSVNGGTYVDRGKTMFEATVGVQRPTQSVLTPMLGVAFGDIEWRGGHDAICVIAVAGGCVPVTPEVRYAALLAGTQAHMKRVGLAGLVGPGAFRVSSDAFSAVSNKSRTTTIFGVMARADVWVRVAPHFEVGGSVATRIMPSYQKERLSANTLSTGIRLYK